MIDFPFTWIYDAELQFNIPAKLESEIKYISVWNIVLNITMEENRLLFQKILKYDYTWNKIRELNNVSIFKYFLTLPDKKGSDRIILGQYQHLGWCWGNIINYEWCLGNIISFGWCWSIRSAILPQCLRQYKYYSGQSHGIAPVLTWKNAWFAIKCRVLLL